MHFVDFYEIQVLCKIMYACVDSIIMAIPPICLYFLQLPSSLPPMVDVFYVLAYHSCADLQFVVVCVAVLEAKPFAMELLLSLQVSVSIW